MYFLSYNDHRSFRSFLQKSLLKTLILKVLSALNFGRFSQTLLEFMKTEAQRPPRTLPPDNNDVVEPPTNGDQQWVVASHIGPFTNQFKLKLKLTELNLNTFLVYFHLFPDKSIFNLTWCFTYSNYPFNISYCSILFDHYWRWNCLWGWLDPSFNWFCNCLCCWFIQSSI